jgi:hypothetical protein
MNTKYLLTATVLFTLLFVTTFSQLYMVSVLQRDPEPLLSYLVKNNSVYKQVFNPTWIQPTEGTNFRKGILARTQDC